MQQKKTTIPLIRNIVWAIIIFILCTMPSQDLPDPQLKIPHMDKIVHFGMFFIMALLLCNELEHQTRWGLKKIFFISVLVVFFYGGLIEILQEFYFKRSGDVMDLLADVTGGIVGCLFYPLAKKITHSILDKNE